MAESAAGIAAGEGSSVPVTVRSAVHRNGAFRTAGVLVVPVPVVRREIV